VIGGGSGSMTSPSTPVLEAADSLLGAVAEAVGAELAWDDNRQCGLAFAGDIEVVLALAPLEGVVTLQAAIASLGGAPSAQPLRQALAMNAGRLPIGMALAVELVSGQLNVVARIPVLDVETTAVVSLLADLVAVVPDVRAELLTADDATLRRGTEPPDLSAPPGGALRI
jgi:hypothetical protein